MEKEKNIIQMEILNMKVIGLMMNFLKINKNKILIINYNK